MYKLLLISQSPRRRQILTDAGFLFSLGTVKISEIIEENVNITDAIVGLAQQKCQAYLDLNKSLKGLNILAISADTMVVISGQPLGKPKNSTEAKEYLRLLSGKTHSVITGVFVYNLFTDEQIQFSDTTEVQFRELNLTEIQDYVATGEPLDKAGAYAIQGEGRKFVKNIMGSLNNVIGFPLEAFEKKISEKGWAIERQ